LRWTVIAANGILMNMTAPDSPASTVAAIQTKRFMRAILGLLLILAGVPIYMLLVDHPMLRRTALPFWLFAAIGLLVTISSLRADKRTRTRIIGGLSFVFTVLFAFGYFVISKVPDSPDFAKLDTAPAFALADHTGRMVNLDAARATGPVLLVFYRGHW
jgi:hypothetical protein